MTRFVYASDGSFEFIGRLDYQIKLHGFRIELGEIETALAKVAGISQAVVILREDRPGDKAIGCLLHRPGRSHPPLPDPGPDCHPAGLHDSHGFHAS